MYKILKETTERKSHLRDSKTNRFKKNNKYLCILGVNYVMGGGVVKLLQKIDGFNDDSSVDKKVKTTGNIL